MPKKLILLRHAEAEFSTLSGKDITRPLTARGLEAADRMARRLEHLDSAPDLVLCSPATRTRQTADIFMKVLQMDAGCLHLDEQLYNASAERLEARLLELAPGRDVSGLLLVAHNPGISYLAYRLGRHQSPGVGRGFTPGSFAVFDVDVDDWKGFSEEACFLRHFELT